MNIPWKLKSFAFKIIDLFNIPGLLYFLQKYVTGRSRIGKLSINPIWESHKNYLKKYNATGKVFEFGAGKNLAQNLFISDLVQEQLVVDLYPMIDLSLVENSRKKLSKIVSLKSNQKIVKNEDLEKHGIYYKAPYDATKTDLDEKIFDACISTNTLEHIPKPSIDKIFTQLHHILKDGGIVSARIDYSDHYAHTDKNISLLNYLKYNEIEWEKYNHKSHYQNRLRHYEYIEIFKNSKFLVLEEELFFYEKNIPIELEFLFKDNVKTWKATSAHIVLKKA